MSDRIKDIIRVANTNTDSIICMREGNTLYMKESSILSLAEENHISNIDFLCKYIVENRLESEYPGLFTEGQEHKYKLIRDKNIPGIVAESYVPEIGDDLISIKFDLIECLISTVGTEVPIDEVGIEKNKMGDSFLGIPIGKIREILNIVFIKMLGFFRADKYSDTRQLNERIRLCKNSLKIVEEELVKVDKNDPSKMYTAQAVTKMMVDLGLKAVLGTIVKSLVPGGIIASMIQTAMNQSLFTALIKNSIEVFTAAQYKRSLQTYKKNLEKTLDYLDVQLKKSQDKRKDLREKSKINREKVQAARKASVNEQSIGDIMV